MLRRAHRGRVSRLARTLMVALTAVAATTVGAAVKRAVKTRSIAPPSLPPALPSRPTVRAVSADAEATIAPDAVVPLSPPAAHAASAKPNGGLRVRSVAEPFLLMQLAAVAVALQWTSSTSPVRALIPVAFVSIGPGRALLRLWDLTAGWAGLALAIALSLSLATIVPGALLYAGLWSPLTALVALAAITFAASMVAIVRGPSESARPAR